MLRLARLFLLLSLPLLSGCTTSRAAPGDGGDEGPQGPPQLFPAELHTGYDGVATFVVPAVVQHADGPVSWSLSDPSVARLETNGAAVTVVAQDVGTATLTAEVGEGGLTAELYVALYDPSLAPLGEAIYTESCASCHVATDGPDHTPSEIGQHADSVLATMIYAGVDPQGEQWPDHKWALEGADMRAMLRHIRQLEPRGAPAPPE